MWRSRERCWLEVHKKALREARDAKNECVTPTSNAPSMRCAKRAHRSHPYHHLNTPHESFTTATPRISWGHLDGRPLGDRGDGRTRAGNMGDKIKKTLPGELVVGTRVRVPRQISANGAKEDKNTSGAAYEAFRMEPGLICPGVLEPKEQRLQSFGYYSVQFETDGHIGLAPPEAVEVQHAISGVQDPLCTAAKSIADLVPLLLSGKSQPVLIVAGPGTGKVRSKFVYVGISSLLRGTLPICHRLTITSQPTDLRILLVHP